MSKLVYVGLDGEMTGSGSRDRKSVASKMYQLIQIGLATTGSDEQTNAVNESAGGLQTYVSDIGFDTWNSQPQAMEVNKFTPERIRAGPRPAAVDAEACVWLDGKVGAGRRDLHAVGWNVGSFDMPFVREYLPSLGDRFSYRSVDLNSILYSVADTEDDYKRLKGAAKSGAEALLRDTGVKEAWHDAGYDAAASLLAFKLLREKILPGKFA